MYETCDSLGRSRVGGQFGKDKIMPKILTRNLEMTQRDQPFLIKTLCCRAIDRYI